MARRAILSEVDMQYIQRCTHILNKTRRKFSQRALADKMNCSLSLINKALAGAVLTVEQSEARRRYMPTRSRQYPIGFNRRLFNQV